MKNIKISIALWFLFSPLTIFSQDNFTNSVLKQLQNNNLIREKVFIHLNKTTYFPKENIWFTTYVANDHNNTPSYYTTNLLVNLLNYNGDVIDSKNIFINDGVGFGDFLLGNGYPSGKYYLQGFTNYMQNFGFENVFIQEIKFLNPATKNDAKQNKFSKVYDIQTFPESGYLLEEAENTIGIKALINGKIHPFSGRIINSNGIEVSNFKGNFLGMGKCNFTYLKNETYTAIININNTTKKIALPKAIKIGVIFSLDNSNSDKIKFTIKTNKETLPLLPNDSFALLFYRNNSINEAISINFTQGEFTEQELFIDKTNMLHGVNIITLFKNNQPIAERKFFIEKPNNQSAILIEELKTENDSINFKIQTINSNFEPISTQISISVLPKDSKIYNETQTIKSAFLLSPYIKGIVENPSFYFRNTNPKEKEYLDLLLLCQGWSAYSLKEKIKEISPKETFHFENGFTLNGKVKKFPKGYDIGILSKKNRLVAFSKLNKNKEFSFENIFAYKNDSIKIAFIKKDVPLVKPNKVSFIEPKIERPKNITTIYDYSSITAKKLPSVTKKNNLSGYKNYPNIEQLDEVVLKNVKTKQKQTIYDIESNMARKHNIIAAGFYKNKKVTRQLEIVNRTLFDYFNSLGFIKPNITNNVESYFISLRNTPATLTNPFGHANSNATYPPKIYINDLPTIQEFDIDMMKELSMSDIDEILINKSGGGGGLNGIGGIIKIYLKKGNHRYFGEENKKLYKSLLLLTGFDRATSFYKPLYNIYTEDAYNLTEIDWKNNLKTNEKGEAFIKIPTNEFSNEFQFIINGFSENGLLFNIVYKTGSSAF
ncbi:MAG: hypothetical protein COB01_10790 [Lutibacter sp.]|nr:MAG: hypothetical protein COB01_10790 [Lutibacter sp.]